MKIFLGIATALFAFTFLAFSGCTRFSSREEPLAALPPPVVEIEKPSRQSMTRTVELPGSVQGYQEAKLYSKVSGYLEKIFVDQGDNVKASQLLAVLSSPELEEQEIELSSKLGQVKTQLLANVAELNESRQTYKRLKQVYDHDPGLLAKEDLDLALAKFQVSKAREEGTRHELKAMEAAVARAAAFRQYTQIKAPFSGIVTGRFLDPGALVQNAANSAQGTSKPILTLANFDTVRIMINVPEPDVPYVHAGSRAVIKADAIPEHPFHGTVTRLSEALDPSTRTMQTEIDLPNSKHFLHPGMLAKVTLDLQTHPKALTVPTSAVVFDKDKRFVYVYDAGKAKKIPVKTGFEEPLRIEILGGLQENEDVMVAGKENVENGSPVEVKNKP